MRNLLIRILRKISSSIMGATMTEIINDGKKPDTSVTASRGFSTGEPLSREIRKFINIPKRLKMYIIEYPTEKTDRN